MAEKFVFEKSMKRLEEIVGLLEKGEVPLDNSIALFEEGTGLVRQCTKALDTAEKKVKMLVSAGEEPEYGEFDEQ